jgi:hypothetical protein
VEKRIIYTLAHISKQESTQHIIINRSTMIRADTILRLPCYEERHKLIEKRKNYIRQSPAFSAELAKTITRYEFSKIQMNTYFIVIIQKRDIYYGSDNYLTKRLPEIIYSSGGLHRNMFETFGQWIWDIDSKQWIFDDLRNLCGNTFANISHQTEYDRIVGHATAILSAFPPDCYDDNM